MAAPQTRLNTVLLTDLQGAADAKSAPRWRRGAAVILDFLLCAIIVGIILGGPQEHVTVTVGHLHLRGSQEGQGLALAWFLYNFAFVALIGATPAKMALRLKVVDAAGAPPDWKKSLIRAMMSLVSAMLGFVGYLWGLWDKEGRTWHDAAADTRVVAARAP